MSFAQFLSLSKGQCAGVLARRGKSSSSRIGCCSREGRAFCSALRWSFSAYHLPGWKNKVCTKDARTRQQREGDRKLRQLEKLPPVEALHDFQYPYEKTVLSDYMFQFPIFENDLDTPHLFYPTPPPNFFLYWNVSDFERTNYPPVPNRDHRFLVPSQHCEQWEEHRLRALRYLEKHQVMPQYFPHVNFKVNLSVVFPGCYSSPSPSVSSSCSSSSGSGEIPSSLPQVTSLKRRNFWCTSHCGNFIELKELQYPPSIFIQRPAALDLSSKLLISVQDAASHEGERDMRAETERCSADEHIEMDDYYTLLLVSPDYPYRLPSYEDKREERGFFLHYMVANLVPSEVGDNTSSSSSLSSLVRPNADEKEKVPRRIPPKPWKGDVIVPYVPPLSTENGGTTRHLCVLYRQRHKVELSNTLSPSSDICPATQKWESTWFPLEVRSNFRLHDPSRALRKKKRESTALPYSGEGQIMGNNERKTLSKEVSIAMEDGLEDMMAVEKSLTSSIPEAITFFHTTWDIQVQEYYEKISHPEPAMPVDDTIEALLEFHSSKPEDFRIRSRHRPDGSTNVGDDPQFWGEREPTRIMGGSMQSLWSRRTSMGSNSVPITYPH